MAIRTNRGRRALTRKELRAMAFQTTRVLRKIGDVSKSGVALAHSVPIFGRDFMTGAAGELLRNYVRRV